MSFRICSCQCLRNIVVVGLDVVHEGVRIRSGKLIIVPVDRRGGSSGGGIHRAVVLAGRNRVDATVFLLFLYEMIISKTGVLLVHHALH